MSDRVIQKTKMFQVFLRHSVYINWASGINREGTLRGQPANPDSPGKMAVKTEYMWVGGLSAGQVQYCAKRCSFQLLHCKCKTLFI